MNKPNKLSYLNNPGQEPLTNKTVGQIIDDSAIKYGDSECLYVALEDASFSFNQIKEQTEIMASGLLKLGLNPGDRIAIWGPNSSKWYITFLAAQKAGLIAVCITTDCTVAELVYCLNKVSIKAILISGQFKDRNFYKILCDAIPDLHDSEAGKLNSATVPHLRSIITMEEEAPGRGVYTYAQVQNGGNSQDGLKHVADVAKTLQCDQVTKIQFTSGSTGSPKGVMITHYNYVNNSYSIAQRLGLNSNDKICLLISFVYSFGNLCALLPAMVAGATIVLPSPSYSPTNAIKVTAQKRCTLIYGTPTMHIDMVNMESLADFDLTSLRSAVTGGSICPSELIKKMKEKFGVASVTSIYGLTEAGVIFLSLPEDDDELRSSTVGYPLENFEVKLIDGDGNLVEIGSPGEVCARGYSVMKGYWDDPQKTAEAIDSDAWLHSGDVGIMTEAGYATIIGRVKDMINRGGQKIVPREVENLLHQHPSILEAQVFGLPDKRLGEVPAVWIRLKDGATLSEAQVKSFCEGQISKYKIPQYIKFTNEFPKS